MRSKVFIQVSYDIHDDVLRSDIAESLIYHCLHRVQRSVFQGLLTSNDRDDLLKTLNGFNLSEGDSVQLLELCSRCTKRGIVLGRRDEPKGYRIL